MKKINYAEILYIYILAHPLLDLITSLTTRFTNATITVGIITKGIAFTSLMIYLIFYNKSKYKHYSRLYLIVMIIFTLIYFITKENILYLPNLISEIIYLFKYMYFPLMFIGIVNLNNEYPIEFSKIVKIFQINAVVFSSIILIAELTNTSFSSYAWGNNQGSVGWFYSANEIGAILTLLFPFTFELIYNEKKKWPIIMLPIIVAMLLIGTKTAYLGLLIPTICFLIYFAIKDKKIFSKKIYSTAILLIIIILMSPNVSAVNNFKENIIKILNNNTGTINIESDNNDDNNVNNKQNILDIPKDKKMNELVFNNRDTFLKNINEIYLNSSFEKKLFGIGFNANKNADIKVINKLIEMDPLDIFYRYGIIGFILYFSPFLMVSVYLINYLLKKRFEIDFQVYLLIYSCCISLFISIFAGHIMGAPSVSIYLLLSLVLLLNYIKFNRQIN